MTDHKPEAAAVAELVEKLHNVKILEVTDPGTHETVPFAVVPRGVDLRSLKPFAEEHLEAPRRIEGTARFDDLASFIAHASRFKTGSSAIFADRKEEALTSVLDYHGPGQPRFGKHRGVYEFPASDEWSAWIAADDRTFDQQAFAEFLEERIIDVVDPASLGQSTSEALRSFGASPATPSRLLELSHGLSIHVSTKVTNATRLASGESTLAFEQTHADKYGGELKIPGAFVVAVPVFRHGAIYQIPVRLRYRVNAGSITWTLKLHGADRAFDHAFREASEQAANATGLPLFYGRPE